jgi:SNF2 family DNA or RNA helicase
VAQLFVPGGPDRFTHQRRGLNALIRQGGIGALLFDPGTGKTAVGLDYASLLAIKAPDGEARILVVAPLAAVDTWVLQARTFVSPQTNWWAEALGGSIEERSQALASRGGNPFVGRGFKAQAAGRGAERVRMLHHRLSLFHDSSPAGAVSIDEIPTPRLVIVIVNIDTLTSRRGRGSRTMGDYVIEGVKRYRPDLLIVDEAHRIKGATTNASRLLARMTSFVKRRIILTGTVMPHGPLDVFGQWRFLDPYAFGETLADGTRRTATFNGFRGRYAKIGGFMGQEIVGYQNLDDMQQIMSRLAVVARKEEALDLPPTTDIVVPVSLTASELTAYRAMMNDLVHRFDDGATASVGNRLVQMMRLRQITAGYLPDDAGQTRRIGNSKVQVIDSIVNDTLTGEKRVVVFGLFTRELDQLAAALARKGTEIMRIGGDTPSDERQRLRQRFGSDDPTRMVMVAQIRTMSLAVNELVTASHAVFASLSQQRDDLVQARDRLNRIGQTKPTTFWYAIALRTIDEVILTSHQQRTDLETAALAHIKSYERR